MKPLLPSAKQAQIFWLSAMGMTSKQIGEITKTSPSSAQSQLAVARLKAADIGLKFTVTPPNKTKNSGLYLKELAEGAGLKPKELGGFEALKKLAQEALVK
jgi:hypothetical protein